MDVVMVGIDRSEASTRAVEFAVRLARGHDERLHLVHVITWSPFSFSTPTENEHRHRAKTEEIDAATEQVLRPRLELVEASGIEATGQVRHGDPVDLLVDLVEEIGATQLIVGRTGDGRPRRTLFGSVPSHLAQLSPVPLTVVP